MSQVPEEASNRMRAELKERLAAFFDELSAEIDQAPAENVETLLNDVKAQMQWRRDRERAKERFRADLRDALKQELAKRFGDLPEAVSARIDVASLSDIQLWIERFRDEGSSNFEAIIAP